MQKNKQLHVSIKLIVKYNDLLSEKHYTSYD